MKLSIFSADKLKLAFFTILPVILAQELQRLFPIVDNHFVATLGNQALLIHNIQFSFINLGQYIGGATATSCLIFWKRTENADKQNSVFYIHMALCTIISVLCMFVAMFYSHGILSHFSVKPEYHHLATIYLRVGLFNMVLQALYLGLMGVVIAINKEKLSFIFAAGLLFVNIVSDYVGVHVFFSGVISPQQIFTPMLIIDLSTTLMLLAGVIILTWMIERKIKGWGIPNFREILRIWFNEQGGAFISGVYPIIYVFQLGAVKTSGSLLVSYQLLMQLTAIFCIPLLATMQVALRDASEEYANPAPVRSAVPFWLQELLAFGLIPTQILLAIFVFFPLWLFHFVFGYTVPAEHGSYIIIFLLASMLGQIGNALTVPIRAKKNSHLVTTGYFISDVIVLVGGTQCLLWFHLATPMTAGIVMFIYTFVYTSINAYFAFK